VILKTTGEIAAAAVVQYCTCIKRVYSCNRTTRFDAILNSSNIKNDIALEQVYVTFDLLSITMATPTPGKHPATQAVATPPVSTPFSTSNHHPAFSPHGPRSVVPSPQQVKKSPANSNTVYGYPSGGGHPTNSSFGAGYDSPSAAMALGGVPGLAELGLDGMSAPGIGSLGGLGRVDEDERKRKLQQVLDILKVGPALCLFTNCV